MKKIIIALICCFLLLPNVASADNSEACQTPYTAELAEKVEEFEDKDATVLEAYAMGLFESVINMFGLNTINRLIFGNPYCIWFESEESSNESDLIYGLFPESIKVKVVDPAFTLFSSVYFIMMALAMLILGIRKSYSFIGINRVSFGEELMMYGIATVCMIFYFFGVDWILLMNWTIVASIKDVLLAQGINTEFGFLMSDSIITAEEINFSEILFLFAEWILLFFLNFVYIIRLFTITVLMIFGGIAIIALLFEKTRHIFKLWLITFLGNVFMQSAQALYLAIVLLFFSLDSSGIVFKFILLLLFLPMSSMMMGWLSLSDGLINVKVAQDATNKAAVGMRVLSRGKNMLGKNKIPSVDSIGKTRISTAATSNNLLNTVASVATTSTSILGATAGLVIGPGGAALGGMAGGMIAKHAIQTPRNLVAGVKGIKDTVKMAKGEGFSMNNIANRRQFFGNMGESIGTFIGKGEFGRSVGHAFSGVSRDRLINSTELGGLGGLTINDITAKYPGAQIQFQQTNQGSGFYLNENGEMKLVSPLGHADTSLKDGEVRLVDYEARPSNFVQGADGQYTPNLNQNSDSPLARVSDAYFIDNNGTKYQDMNSDASKLNPMDYYKGGTGTDRTLSDRFADNMPFSRNSNWRQ